MNDKIENIKKLATSSKKKIPAKKVENTSTEIKLYKEQIDFIQNEINSGIEIVKGKKQKFQKEKQIIIDKKMKYNEQLKEIKKAFLRYMISCMELNRIGSSIIFIDKSQGKYLEVAIIENINHKTSEVTTTRTIEHRENMVVRSMIQKEALNLINDVISTAEESIIMKRILPFYKKFSPTSQKLGADFFNVYTPNGFLEIDVKNIYDLEYFNNKILPEKYPHINSLFENLSPAVEEKLYLLNWLSYIFNSGLKTRNSIALIGTQGTGKGVLQQILEYAFHVDNCYTATNEDIRSSFNGYIENRIFIFFNEIKSNFSESSTQANKIKPFISDSHISLNDKFRKQVLIENHANCLFFSNHDLPFQIEDKDRRYSVIKTSNKTLVTVAKEQFNKTINQFIKAIEKEREAFLIELKMIEFQENLALSLLDNEVKRKIKEQTNTIKDIIKDKVIDKNSDWFENHLSDLIEGIEAEYMVDREVSKEIENQISGDKTVIKTTNMFKNTNEEMKNFLIQEVKQGVYLNETLRWFTKIYDITTAKASDRQFGTFWNSVVNDSTLYKLFDEEGMTKVRLRLLELDQATLFEVFIHGKLYRLKEGTGKTLVRISESALENKEIPF